MNVVRVMLLSLGFTLAAASTGAAQHQNFGAVATGDRNLVQVEVGADNAFVAGLGYGRVLRWAERPVVVGVKFTVPWASLDLGDYRLSVGAALPIIGKARWKLVASIDFMLRSVKTDLARSTNLGPKATIVGGYYAPGWFIAGEFGVDWAMSTHVAHSQRYLDTIYPEAKSGWYANAGGNLNYGLLGGASFGRYDLVLRLGQGRDLRGVGHLLPMYATLALNARF